MLPVETPFSREEYSPATKERLNTNRFRVFIFYIGPYPVVNFYVIS
jgi:hypothetical protein